MEKAHSKQFLGEHFVFEGSTASSLCDSPNSAVNTWGSYGSGKRPGC